MLSPQEQETLDSYNKIAEPWSKTLHDGFWAEEYKTFQKYLPHGKVLDLGCGYGRDSEFFTKNGYDYIGIDISPEMIRLARRDHPQAKFDIGDIYKLNFLEGNFNGFWAACSLLHIPKQNLTGALASLKIVLKHDAIGFVSVKQGSGEIMKEWQHSGHKRFFAYYEPEEFAAKLKESGFEILEMRPHVPYYPTDGDFYIYYVKVL
jgi:SAM-dependent methyltransferase